MKLFIANIPCVVLSCISGYMAIQGIEGWGWFLGLGILCFLLS